MAAQPPWGPTGPPPGYQPEPQPGPVYQPPPRRKRHIVRWVLLGFAALVVVIVVASAASGGGGGGGGKHDAAVAPVTTAPSAQPSSNAAPPTASGPPPAAPKPDGTYSGSCDYTLGSDPVGGTAVAVGEIDVKNTGNVGTKLRVKLTWPQEGYAPLSEVKHVKLGRGANKAVRFHLPLTSTQLDNLQNYQSGHDFNDGCTYHSTITGTFGPTS